MKNLIISGLLMGSVAFGATKWHLHSKVADSVDMAVLMISPFVSLEYDGVSSTLSGELTIDNVRARVTGFKDEIYVERVGVDTPSFLTLLKLADITSNFQSSENVLPKYFGFIAEGIRMDVNADYFRKIYDMRLDELGVEDSAEANVECTGKYGFSPKALAALGYSQQVVSLSMIFRQENSNYVIDIDSSSQDMWDVDIEMTLVGDMITELSKGTAYRPKMSNLRVAYADRSLNQRVQKYCGQRGLSNEEILAAQLDAFKFMGESNGIQFD